MILFPEKHSVSIYKASILEIMSKNTLPENQNITQNETLPQNEILPPNEDTGDMISPPLNEEVNENNSPDDTQDESSLRQEKKEILRQHLLKKYSSS